MADDRTTRIDAKGNGAEGKALTDFATQGIGEKSGGFTFTTTSSDGKPLEGAAVLWPRGNAVFAIIITGPATSSTASEAQRLAHAVASRA